MIRGFLLLLALASVALPGGVAKSVAFAGTATVTSAVDDDPLFLPSFVRIVDLAPAESWPTRQGPSSRQPRGPHQSGADDLSVEWTVVIQGARASAARAALVSERNHAAPLALARAGRLAAPGTGPPPLHRI